MGLSCMFAGDTPMSIHRLDERWDGQSVHTLTGSLQASTESCCLTKWTTRLYLVPQHNKLRRMRPSKGWLPFYLPLSVSF
jgi:hypothetical protein